MANIDTKEVSLVKRPASRRDFAVTKGEISEMDELLQAILETEADSEEALVEALTADGLDVKAIEVAKGVMRLASAYSDEFNEETFLAIGKAVGFKLEQPSNDPADKKTIVTKSDLSKIEDEETRTRVEALLKSQGDLTTTVEDLTKRLDAREDERRTAEFVTKASGLGELGINAADLGKLLKGVADSDSDSADKILEVLTAANAQVETAALFKEVGSSRAGIAGGTVADEIESLAKALVAKTDGLTLAVARDEVLKSDIELSARYSREVRNPE